MSCGLEKSKIDWKLGELYMITGSHILNRQKKVFWKLPKKTYENFWNFFFNSDHHFMTPRRYSEGWNKIWGGGEFLVYFRNFDPYYLYVFLEPMNFFMTIDLHFTRSAKILSHNFRVADPEWFIPDPDPNFFSLNSGSEFFFSEFRIRIRLGFLNS